MARLDDERDGFVRYKVLRGLGHIIASTWHSAGHAIVVGLLVANSHHYFAHLDGFKPIASAVLAVLLWPLILFGVSLHIK